MPTRRRSHFVREVVLLQPHLVGVALEEQVDPARDEHLDGKIHRVDPKFAS
jgi:hypothetical protein